MRISAFIPVIGAALLGGVLGGAAVAFGGRPSAALLSVSSAPRAQRPEVGIENRLRALESRSALLGAGVAQTEQAVKIEAADTTTTTILSDEAAREAHARFRKDEHERVLSTFTAESQDRNWAPRVEAELRRELIEIAARNDSELLSVECRETICLATVRWPSYGAALEHYANYLTKHYKLNCETSAQLPPPHDTMMAAHYDARIVLNFETTKNSGD